MSEESRSELAGRLHIIREASERDYNPLPCPLPTSPWGGKWGALTNKISLPGRSSSSFNPAAPSSSACFRPSSWITTWTT